MEKANFGGFWAPSTALADWVDNSKNSSSGGRSKYKGKVMDQKASGTPLAPGPRGKKARAQKTCPAEGPTLRARKAQKIGKAEKARPEQNKGGKNARQAKSQATRELRCLRHPASGTKHLLSEQQRNYSAAQLRRPQPAR